VRRGADAVRYGLQGLIIITLMCSCCSSVQLALNAAASCRYDAAAVLLLKSYLLSALPLLCLLWPSSCLYFSVHLRGQLSLLLLLLLLECTIL
jgi:hypothetical protein